MRHKCRMRTRRRSCGMLDVSVSRSSWVPDDESGTGELSPPGTGADMSRRARIREARSASSDDAALPDSALYGKRDGLKLFRICAKLTSFALACLVSCTDEPHLRQFPPACCLACTKACQIVCLCTVPTPLCAQICTAAFTF